jgi:hypothetical protein
MELRNCKVMLVQEKEDEGKVPKYKWVVQPPDRRTLFMYAEKVLVTLYYSFCIETSGNVGHFRMKYERNG